jgi:multisubunit Na+/H+ antiporter MnhC subunit
MKTSVIVGALLIVLGAAGLVYKNFSYESEETIAQIGDLKATAETEKNVPIPAVLSIVAIVAGVLVIAVGSRK